MHNNTLSGNMQEKLSRGETDEKGQYRANRAGGMANGVHYPSLKECEDVNLVGLCDLVPSKLQATAERFEIDQTFTDYKQMLEKTSPDAVYILMPPQHLFPLAIHCLSQQHHVFIEKPPGVTLHQTKEMALAAEKNDCKTMVGFNRRFIPLLQKVKAMVEANGPIIQCMSTFHKNTPNALYYDGVIDVLTCDAIHAVDALRWLGGGEVKAVASDINSFYAERENSFNALVKFTSGASGYLGTNWAVGGRIHTFEMHARGISAYINPDAGGARYFIRPTGLPKLRLRTQRILISCTELTDSMARVGILWIVSNTTSSHSPVLRMRSRQWSL